MSQSDRYYNCGAYLTFQSTWYLFYSYRCLMSQSDRYYYCGAYLTPCVVILLTNFILFCCLVNASTKPLYQIKGFIISISQVITYQSTNKNDLIGAVHDTILQSRKIACYQRDKVSLHVLCVQLKCNSKELARQNSHFIKGSLALTYLNDLAQPCELDLIFTIGHFSDQIFVEKVQGHKVVLSWLNRSSPKSHY